MHLPLAIYRGLGGEEEGAIPLAAAISLLSLGVHLHDDLADNGLAPHWEGYKISEINLAATTLCAALPQCIMADLDMPPVRRAAIQRAIANAMLGMAAGQQRDLALAGSSNVTAAEAEAVAVAEDRRGADPLHRAGRPLWPVPGRKRFASTRRSPGRLGTGGGLASDCYDLFTAPQSRISPMRSVLCRSRCIWSRWPARSARNFWPCWSRHAATWALRPLCASSS